MSTCPPENLTVEGGAPCSGDERDDVLKPILCVGMCQCCSIQFAPLSEWHR
jgi:hypothetical protein